jgi:HD-GYP domain-containing protein (c-di-GMP phosphodiesterase class II)
MGAFDSLEKQKESLSPADYKLVLEHPNIAANSIKNVPGIPPHVEMIIRQHHEHPMGIGYPTKCGYQKIVPFASVFIVAHDLTDYILLNPKWNTSHPRQCIENYTAQSLDKFHGPHFSKIFRILPLIE